MTKAKIFMPSDAVTNEEKLEFCKEYMVKENFELIESLSEGNAEMRAVAKLLINALWGKFAQKADSLNTEITLDPGKFCNQIILIIALKAPHCLPPATAPIGQFPPPPTHPQGREVEGHHSATTTTITNKAATTTRKHASRADSAGIHHNGDNRRSDVVLSV
ncbi:hypothetical protein CRE_20874 [Caenorhabditis remanei]|uniref:DNA-directed DNA polymerase n=2 Tax=Caenorhabditis remanei TaxID=31234 RepID=E3MV17_CAERE|nr:hypothetical protein CRE_20874 [Caenorhabditis remanei]